MARQGGAELRGVEVADGNEIRRATAVILTMECSHVVDVHHRDSLNLLVERQRAQDVAGRFWRELPHGSAQRLLRRIRSEIVELDETLLLESLQLVRLQARGFEHLGRQ